MSSSEKAFGEISRQQGDFSQHDLSASPQLTQRLAQNSFAAFSSQLLTLLANTGITVILARSLGESQFGLFSYGLVLVNMFAILADFGMKPILVRELSREHWQSGELLGNAVLIKLLLSGLTIALAIVTSWFCGYPREFVLVVAMFACNVLVTSKLFALRIAFEAPFHANLQMAVPMLLQLLDNLLSLGVIYVLALQGASLQALVLAYVVCNMPGMLLTIYLARQRVHYQFTPNPALIRFILKESWPLGIYILIMTLYNSIDVLMLEAWLGESAVGQYAAATRLVTPLLFIPHGVVVSLFPIFSRYHESSPQHVALALNLALKIVSLIALVLAICFSFWGESIITLLYSERYHAAIVPLVILMWAQVFFFLNFFFVDTLTSVDQQRINFAAAAVMLLINASALVVLIPKFGLPGAALGKLISSGCGFAILFHAICKNFNVHVRGFLLRATLVGSLFALGLAFFMKLQPLASIIAAPILFVSLVLTLKVFNKEEMAIFRSAIRTSVSVLKP